MTSKNQDIDQPTLTSPAPSAPPLPTASEIEEEDVEAEASAAAARDRGTSLIRDHVREHLAQNPTSSYVSWIATLHPENATITIDPRFLIPGNPWIAVYQEAKQDLYAPKKGRSSSTNSGSDGLDDDSSGRSSDNGDGDGVIHVETATPVVVPTPSTTHQTSHHQHGGILDLILGFIMTVSAVGVTFGIEFFSVFMYLSYVLFSRMATKCSRPRVTIIKVLPFVLLWLLAQIFRFVDIILLLASTAVVELLASISAFLCGLIALSCDVGRAAHQRTRRMAHLTRWACRRPFAHWKPARTTLGCFGGDEAVVDSNSVARTEERGLVGKRPQNNRLGKE